jgi:hypothetical protein
MDENRNRRAFTHFLNAKNDWFRVYKVTLPSERRFVASSVADCPFIQDFFVPSEAFHVHFLRNKLIVVCQKGFEIIDLTECVFVISGLDEIANPHRLQVEPWFDSCLRFGTGKERCRARRPPLEVRSWSATSGYIPLDRERVPARL